MFGTGNATITFYVTPQPCPRCSHPDAIVMKRSKLLKLLEDTRRLTHPDVCASERATEITALINSCIDELRT